MSEFPWIEDLSVCQTPNGIFEFQYVPFVSCYPICLVLLGLASEGLNEIKPSNNLTSR